MAQWDTFLFDLDGTLVNTIDDLADAVETVLSEFGFGRPDGTPVHTREEYRQFVGNGAAKLVQRAFGEQGSPELWQSAYKRFLTVYDQHCLVKTQPYTGIYPLLDALQAGGYRLGVVTNKPEKQAIKLIEGLFSRYRFCCVYGGKEGRPHKPDPTSLQAAMRDCGVVPQTTLYIGDSNVDVYTAHNGGLVCAGACWGFRGEEELRKAGADILLNHPSDLFEYL